MSETTKSNKKIFTTRNIVSCAMLSACAIILTYLEFPTFIAPSFYRFNVSDLPALIGGFAMGPVAGVIIELIKSLVMLIVNPANPTMGIGELSNFVLGCIYVVPAALIYRSKKTKGRAVISLVVGGLLMSILATFLNAFVMIPLYATAFNMPVDTIIQMGTAIFPFVDSMFDFCLVCVLPFNLIKAFVVSVITVFIYKPLSVLIKGLN
ncbi:MAG: ECF transporter S component [Ruminococcus sp.]|nr:ECF transporter S component [Ruminococcus sp.]